MSYKKKELLGIIASLQKINEAFESGCNLDMTAAAEALVNCQESAIMVGNSVEAYGEPGEEIVHILEEYCEGIYQMSISLGDTNQRKKISKKIQKQLFQVSNKIKYSLPDNKRVILFLPYKAAMWDSMESIWENTANDESCEAHVVPIPYFEKKPDGSFGEMFYEGDLYPDYVSAIGWETYDLEKNRPDVVYIHNPYDNCNKVTSIHPDFYIERLKKYSDQIVYVPYFSTLSFVEKHFCVAPGTLYADKVIVQTNSIKKIYQKAIREFEKENGWPKNYFHEKEKFLVYGSPKLDRALHLKDRDYEIPDEWKNIVYRSDGSRKKVILFNTSVQELLLYAEQQLEKIRNVIALFQKEQDVVLLWRPHPLNESTAKAMLPHILKEYLEIKQSFKELKIGILDDTPDLYRAIAVSDAYYGTGGSLITLYGLTGKPIMRENTEILDLEKENVNRYAAFTYAHIESNGTLWFSNMEFNSLFFYDIQADKLTWKGMFPNELFYRKHIYSKYIKYKNKLVFPPFAGNEIAIYDVDREEFKKILIEREGIKKTQFYGTAVYGSRFFAFGAELGVTLIMDMDTFDITYQEDMYKELKKYCTYTDSYFIGADVVTVDSICYLFSKRANIIVEFHMDDLTYKFWTIGSKRDRFQSMQKFRDKIYLFPKSGNKIICWDFHKGTEYEIVSPDPDIQLDNAYNYSCEYDDELYLFAFLGNHNAKIPRGREEIEIIEKDIDEYGQDGPIEIDINSFPEQKISWSCTKGDYIYYFSTMNKMLYIKDMKTGQLDKRHLLISNEDFAKLRRECLFWNREECTTSMQCIYKENIKLTLSDYVEWLKGHNTLISENQRRLFLQENAENHDNCGILCHQKINLA